MLFRNDVLSKMETGEITLAFRRWRKPTVRAGGSLRTAVGVLSIDTVEIVRPDRIAAEDALRAGYPDRETLIAELDARPDGDIHRIAFHIAGADPRSALREKADLGAAGRDDIATKLAGFDARSPKPWAFETLRLIASRDGMTAGDIAGSIGLEKSAIKQNIRKLKELGLTESLKSGYRISPRGRAFLAGC